MGKLQCNRSRTSHDDARMRAYDMGGGGRGEGPAYVCTVSMTKQPTTTWSLL